MFRIDVTLGETRLIEFEALSHRASDVVKVLSADYVYLENNAVVASGACSIADARISVILTPRTKGYHLLRITWRIGVETRVEEVVLNVH